MTSAHVDTFAKDRLPPAELQPEYLFTLPALQFPAQLNCATELLDNAIGKGWGDRLCIQAPGLRWTYAELLAQANRIANVLVQDMGLVPGNRVLLRAPNNPMLVASWFAVMKAGGIAVATMPLLRAKELRQMIAKGEVSHALCDMRLADDLRAAAAEPDGAALQHIRYFNTAPGGAPRAEPGSRHGTPERYVHQCGHSGGRHLHPGLHLRHHRGAQGHHALPP